jgi:hypothetical protein
MFQIQAPILIVPTADAKLTLGIHLRAAGLAACREIALAAKGLEIAHLQFVFRGLTLAVCSRVRLDGIVEMESLALYPDLENRPEPQLRPGPPRAATCQRDRRSRGKDCKHTRVREGCKMVGKVTLITN